MQKIATESLCNRSLCRFPINSQSIHSLRKDYERYQARLSQIHGESSKPPSRGSKKMHSLTNLFLSLSRLSEVRECQSSLRRVFEEDGRALLSFKNQGWRIRSHDASGIDEWWASDVHFGFGWEEGEEREEGDDSASLAVRDAWSFPNSKFYLHLYSINNFE